MLTKLVAWGDSCGLKFNADKTVVVLFIRKHKLPVNFIKFENKVIPYSHQVRYLGVELDSKLHWKPHIHEKIKNAKRRIMQLANLTSNSSGPCPKPEGEDGLKMERKEIKRNNDKKYQ